MRLFISSLSNGEVQDDNVFSPSGGDLTDEMQAFINDKVGTQITIGFDRSTVYEIDKPMLIPSNSDIIIGATIKMAASEIRLLTADVFNGDNVIPVENANQYFRAGQQIVASDDSYPIGGGGSYKTRLWGHTNWVQSVTSTEIICVYPFTNTRTGSFLVSENAKVGQYNSALNVQDTDNVTISGTGLLDGNYVNQYGNYVVGIRWDNSVEALEGSCGLTLQNTSNLTYSGVDVLGWTLHGMSSYQVCSFNSFDGVVIDGSGEKSCAWLGMRDSTFNNITGKNGVWEGDVAFYSGNQRCIITNIHTENNRRLGLNVIGLTDSSITDCTATDDTLINLQGSTVSNVTITNLTGNGVVKGTGIVAYDTDNITITNVSLSQSGTGGLSIGMTLNENLTIEGLTVNGNSSDLLGLDRNNNVLINNIDIDSIGRLVYVNVTNTNIKLSNGEISNYGNIEIDTENVCFENVYDVDLDVMLNTCP